MESINYRDVFFTLKDGVNLQSRIWIPREGGPWPALLMRQPYGKTIASTVTYAHPEWWASNGYLVIVQDVRGQGKSDGNFKGFQQEASDTSETHDWVRSLPECNGRLGTYGFSYQGITQLLAEVKTTPPDCLAPAMTGLNECQHWSCEGGAYWWHICLSWGLQLAAMQANRKKDWMQWELIRKSLESGNYLREGQAILEKYDPDNMPLKWLRESNKIKQEWKVHKALSSWLKQPMLLIGGWWDPHLNGMLDIYHKSISAKGNPELHIGPATHLQWWEGSQSLHLNFFNKHLKDINYSSKKNTNKLWNLTTKKWQTPLNYSEKSNNLFWTLSSTGMANFDSKDGHLNFEGSGEGLINLVHDPWRPVPSVGGHLSQNPGFAERSAIDVRLDVATFTSKPLKKSISIEGIPKLELLAEADQEGFDLCIALSLVNRNQTKVKQLSTGVHRFTGPGATQRLKRKVFLQPLLAEIPSGERLRVSIAPSSWPAVGINPGHLRESPGAPNSNCLVVTLKIFLSQSRLDFDPLFHQ